MYNDDLESVLAVLPQSDVPFAGPLPSPNAYICVEHGLLQIYPCVGGWLGAKLVDLRADAAPWAD